MVLRRTDRALKWLLGGLHRSVGGSWRGLGLGCHVDAQDGSESTKNQKNQEAGGSGVVF